MIVQTMTTSGRAKGIRLSNWTAKADRSMDPTVTDETPQRIPNFLGRPSVLTSIFHISPASRATRREATATEAELRRESSGDLSGRETSTATMAARAPAVMPAFISSNRFDAHGHYVDAVIAMVPHGRRIVTEQS